MESNFTQTVYWNPDAELVFKAGNYCVKALKDLPTGTLIMIEHVISGTTAESVGSVMVDDTLYAQLYPRNARDKPCGDMDMRERNMKAQTKVEMNAFRFDDAVVVGNMFSKFNHCCQPNCHMAQADKPNLGGCIGSVPIYGMWVMGKVRAGDELTIDYTSGYAKVHDEHKKKFGWECSCTRASLAVSKGLEKTDIRANLCFKLANMQKDFIKSVVDTHLMTEKGFDILLRHVLAKRGLYETKMGYIGTTAAAAKLDPLEVVEKYTKQVRAKWNNYKQGSSPSVP